MILPQKLSIWSDIYDIYEILYRDMKSKWDINKIETKATTFGTGSHIITPVTWNNKVIVAMLKSKWDEMRGKINDA